MFNTGIPLSPAWPAGPGSPCMYIKEIEIQVCCNKRIFYV